MFFIAKTVNCRLHSAFHWTESETVISWDVIDTVGIFLEQMIRYVGQRSHVEVIRLCQSELNNRVKLGTIWKIFIWLRQIQNNTKP